MVASQPDSGARKLVRFPIMGDAQGSDVCLEGRRCKNSDDIAVGVNGRGLFHKSVHIKLVVDLLTHRRSLNEYLEHNITAVSMMYEYLR